jgi:hypothetical protein
MMNRCQQVREIAQLHGENPMNARVAKSPSVIRGSTRVETSHGKGDTFEQLGTLTVPAVNVLAQHVLQPRGKAA